MKSCPKCGRAYDDASLNFCLDDGEWLHDDNDDANPTRSMPAGADPGEAATKHRIVNTDETAILPTGSVPEAPKTKRRGSHWKFTLPALIVLAALIAGAYYVYRQVAVWSLMTKQPEIQVERLTGDGKTRDAAISPDGKFLAYLQVNNEDQSLWVRQVETNSTVEILKAGDFATIRNVMFSPDANFVFFGGIEAGKGKSVYKVPTLGGTPVKIPVDSMSFSLSPDGQRIAYYGDDPGTTETWLSISRLDGSDVKKIVSRKGKVFVETETSWSPDGQYVAFLEGEDDAILEPDMSLSVYSIRDEKQRQVVSRGWRNTTDKGVLWDPSGRFLYVMAEGPDSQTRQLWSVRFPEGETTKLTSNSVDYTGISVTSDGGTFVTIGLESRTGIWVSSDLDPNNAVEVLPARGDTWGLDWTPDGRIVYASDQSGAPEIWSMNPDGTDQKQLTSDRIGKMIPNVSPAGDTIVYFSPEKGMQIFTVPVSGGSPTKLNTELVSPGEPSYSADGKWIVYSAWTGGKNRIYRIPASGGRSERLTEYTAFAPRYSPDGTFIACIAIPDGASRAVLAVIPAEGGAPVKTFDIPVTADTRRGPLWTPDGKAITFLDFVGEHSDLWAQPVDGGPRKKLTNFGRPWLYRRAYSRDGKRIAVTRGEIFWNAIMLKVLK